MGRDPNSSPSSARRILILGGARSGKSTFAEDLARRRGGPVTVIATAEAFDDEMAERIEAHRSLRPLHWTTVEEPIRVDEALAAISTTDAVILDCVTVWLGNMFHHGRTREDAQDVIERFIGVMAHRSGSTLIVSNEVGMGIVPATESGRLYRDALGQVNARMAAAVDSSILMIAGRFLELHDVGTIL